MNEPKVVQVIPFSGTISNYGRSIAWSENNDLAFCTLECVHILEPLVFTFSVDASAPIAIHREVIQAPTEFNEFDFGINRHEMHLTLPRDEMYRFMLDRTLSPAVPCTPSFKGFGEASWSPVGVGPLGTCALATLTKDHRLSVFMKQNKKWVEIAELSLILYEYLKAKNYDMPWITNISTSPFASPSLQGLQMKAYATAAVRMTWSHIIFGESRNPSLDFVKRDIILDTFALLAVGMKNGCIVLWKMKTSINSGDDIELETIFDTNLGIISAIHWTETGDNSGLLIVGSQMGQICMYSVVVEPSETAVISFAHVATLWSDNDRLEVSHIASFRESQDTVFIVAGKGCFIAAWEVVQINVQHRAHVVGDFLQPLTGLFADTGSFMASTGDGTLLRIFLNRDDREETGLSISLHRMLVDLEDKNLTYAGICCSPNKLLFCFIQNISCFFDHLAIREPIKLFIATNKTMNETVSIILTLSEGDISYSYFADILQYIFYSWLEQKQLPDVLMPLLELNERQLRMQTLSKLQLLRWLLRLVLFGEQDDLKAGLCRAQLEIINKLLIEQQLLQLVRKLDSGSVSPTIEKDWTPVLTVICQWLNNFIEELEKGDQKMVQKIYKEVVSIANDDDKGTIFQEVCCLCKEYIPLDNIHYGKCPRGHVFGRCSLSFSLCVQPTYKKCANCSVFADRDAYDLIQNARCPFCSRIFD